MAEFRVADRVDAQHPCLPGHFPGQPIVPGVLLLQRVVAAAREQLRGASVTGIPAVKFLQPLLPEQDYSIVLQIDGLASVKFRCEAGAQLLAQGTLALAAVP